MIDAFLKIDGIDGESTDDKHQKWIELLAYKWNVTQTATGSRSSGGARTAERANHGDFTWVHSIDAASPKLFLKCCDGTHIKQAIVELNRATGKKEKYMEYKMNDIIVSSVAPTVSKFKDSEALPTEEVSFNYGKIEMTYVQTDQRTGAAKGNIKAGWDLVSDKPV